MKELDKNELMEVDGGMDALTYGAVSALSAVWAVFKAGFEEGWSEHKA